jgi:hypothetical protein
VIYDLAPKSIAAGVTSISGDTPLPLKSTVGAVPDALLFIVTVLPCGPAELGVKVKDIVLDVVGGTTIGELKSFVNAKPGDPEKVGALSTRFADPVFVTVIACGVLVVPKF